MNIDFVFDKVSSKLYQNSFRKFFLLSAAFAALGVIGFIIQLLGDHPERAWMAYLINLIYFMGLAQAGIIVSVIFFLSKAKWGRVLKRFAEGFGFFLPFAFLGVIILIFGADYLYPWIKHPIEQKAIWLNKSGFFIRNLIALAILFSLSLVYLYYSIRPDAGYLIHDKKIKAKKMLGFFAGSWKGLGYELNKTQSVSGVLTPIIGFLYAVIFSFVGIDFVMSLDPSWVSTLFGAYIFMTSIFQALAALAIVTVLLRDKFDLKEIITPDHFYDLGILTFAFTMVCLDFFYSQFLVIWYGNMPEETHYIILRTAKSPWQAIAYLVLAVAFAVPFIGLISKKIKRSPKAFLVVAVIILAGMWFERFILIAPAVWHFDTLPFGIFEILITLGFFGCFSMVYLCFLKNIPILPVTDPLLYQQKRSH